MGALCCWPHLHDLCDPSAFMGMCARGELVHCVASQVEEVLAACSVCEGHCYAPCCEFEAALPSSRWPPERVCVCVFAINGVLCICACIDSMAPGVSLSCVPEWC